MYVINCMVISPFFTVEEGTVGSEHAPIQELVTPVGAGTQNALMTEAKHPTKQCHSV